MQRVLIKSQYFPNFLSINIDVPSHLLIDSYYSLTNSFLLKLLEFNVDLELQRVMCIDQCYGLYE